MIIIHPGAKNNVVVIFNQDVDSYEKMVERDFIVCCIESLLDIAKQKWSLENEYC
jgi:hypothetical protein